MTNSVVLASGENTPNETAVKAFDGDIYTKWLTFTNTGWIAYDYTSTNAYAVTQYSITSANDGDARDPKNWEFQGSNDGGMSWDTLDTQVNQDFTARYQTKSYTTANSSAYKVYRLNITANNGDSKTQLAELELSYDAPDPNNAPAFAVDPFSEVNALENAPYSGTIADDASDPESDPMTFSRVSGPSWLSVAADGTLSGTPTAGDVGLNSFTVQVNATGGSDMATLNITVDPEPEAYISDIAMSSTSSKGRKTGIATITVLDDLGNPVSGATVDVTWTGTYAAVDSGSTDTAGTIVFQTSANKGGVTYTITVDNVTADGLAYNSSLNLETTDTISP
jgi:hypothetical protein